MPIFTEKPNKEWKLNVAGTKEQKAKYDDIVSRLKEVNPSAEFNIVNQLEENINTILIKAQKELKKIETSESKTTDKEQNNSSNEGQKNNELVEEIEN